MLMQACPRRAREDRAIRRSAEILAARWRDSDEATSLADPVIAIEYFRRHLHGLQREEFHVGFLDRRHRLLAVECLSIGTIAGAEVHPREVAKQALHHNAAAVILAHNHPSGVPTPSLQDVRLTELLTQVLSLLDVEVLDHIVVGAGSAVSMSEMRLMSLVDHARKAKREKQQAAARKAAETRRQNRKSSAAGLA